MISSAVLASNRAPDDPQQGLWSMYFPKIRISNPES